MSKTAEEALIKVGEFIRLTGNEVRDVKEACMNLTLAIIDMNKILIEMNRKINELDKR